MYEYTTYNTTTGEIIGWLEVSSVEQAFANSDPANGVQVVFGVGDHATEMVDISTFEIVPRPVIQIEDQTLFIGQEVSLPLPAGVVLWTEEDQEHVLTDGLLELSGDIADVYSLKLSLWPYVDKTLKVTIHEA